MVAFKFLNDLAFSFWRVSRFYKAQICGLLDFMLSELRGLARTVCKAWNKRGMPAV